MGSENENEVKGGTALSSSFQEDMVKDCKCNLPMDGFMFKSQAGQDRYLLQRIFFPQQPCCKLLYFVEFVARNGIDDSTTEVFEKSFGWKGLILK